MHRIESNIERISSIMSERLLRKNIISNYYNQSFQEGSVLYYTERSAVLSVFSKTYYRLYILSDDEKDCIGLLKCLPLERYTVSIPSKKEITEANDILTKSGFKHTDTFVRLANTKIKPGNIEKVVFAKKEQITQIIDLFIRHFKDYVSYIPDSIELEQLIDNKNVIVKEENGVIKGAFIFEFYGKKAYFRIWVDESKQGLDLIINAFAVVASKGINYVYNWVNMENTKSLTIYKFFGAKPDGLYDYVFIKER